VEDISSEKAKLASEVDELISNLIQLRSSIVPREALEARALAYIDADISMLQQIKSRALEAKTLAELNRLRQELESIRSKYAVQQRVAGKEITVAINTDKGVLELKFNVTSTGSGGTVAGRNVDFYSSVSNDNIAVRIGKESYTLTKDEMAKLFAGLWASSSYLTRDHWELLYRLAGGDSLKEAVRKWLNGEKLTEEDIFTLSNGALALAQNRALFDYSTAKDITTPLGVKLSSLLYEGLFNSLAPAEKASYNLNPANWFKSEEQKAQDLYNMLIEKLKKGELAELPGKSRWVLEDVSQIIAKYTPLNYVYTSVRNSLAPYIGNVAAGGVAGAATSALLMSLPAIGAVAGGPAGATAGAVAQQALLFSAIASALPAVAGVVSQLKDPDAQKALADFLSKPENWKPIIEEVVASVAGATATAIAMQKLLPVVLSSDKVWSRLPEKARQGLRSIGISPEYRYLEGKVILVQVENQPTQETYYVLYDPNSRTLDIAVDVRGKSTIVEKQELTAELKEYMKQFLTAEGMKIDPGVSDIDLAKMYYLKVTEKLSGMGFTPKQIQNIIEASAKSPSSLYNFLKDLPKMGRGLLAVTADTSEGVIGAQTSTTDAVLYSATDKYMVSFATKDFSEVQAKVANIRSLLDEAKGITRLVASQLKQQVTIKPGDSAGSFKVMANIMLTGVDESTAKSIADAFRAYVQSLRSVSPVGGGVPPQYYLQMYNVPRSLWEPLTNAMEALQASIMQGIDAVPVIVSSSGGATVMILTPPAVSTPAIQQAIKSSVESGVKPETFGLRAVPIRTQVVETVVATRTAETVVKSVNTVYTGTSETIGLRENAVHRIESVPLVTTRTAEAVFTRTVIAPTAVVETVSLAEKPIRRTDTVPYVVTRTAEVVTTAVRFVPTAFSETAPLSEKPVHRTETVPVVSTRTATAIAPVVIPVATGIVETVPLAEKPVRRTETVPAVITQTNTFIVATTTTIIATVSETGTVSVVTIPLVITYTITVPITITTAAPAPPPPTPTETGVGMPTPIASPPLLPRLPGLEGAGLVPSPAKPEKKPEVEKEVLVI
jgi:hypothetical protein